MSFCPVWLQVGRSASRWTGALVTSGPQGNLWPPVRSTCCGCRRWTGRVVKALRLQWPSWPATGRRSSPTPPTAWTYLRTKLSANRESLQKKTHWLYYYYTIQSVKQREWKSETNTFKCSCLFRNITTFSSLFDWTRSIKSNNLYVCSEGMSH